MSHCISQKVSWLTLEQYRLGDLDKASRAKVESHIDECKSCADDLALINNDSRVLKPLPSSIPALREADILSRRSVWVTTLALAATAAALAIVIGVLRKPEPTVDRPSQMTFKGGDLALTVVREREGVISESPTHFEVDDRFMLYLTHPLPDPVNWEVVVFQDGDASFPYLDHPPLPMGNRVPIPGAFRLTDELPALICVMIGDDLPSAEEIRRQGLDVLPEATVCVEIWPVAKD